MKWEWTIAYFVGRKNKGGLCLKLYQFERIIQWCLSILESIMEFVMEYALQSIMKFAILEKKLKKSHGLP